MGKIKKRRKAKLGPGRFPSATGPPSRAKYKCQVPGCSMTSRSDQLQMHYKNFVLFNTDGEAVDEANDDFKSSSNMKKMHTSYFFRHGFTRNNLPPMKLDTAADTWKNQSISSYFQKRNSDNSEQSDSNKSSDTDDELNSSRLTEPVNSLEKDEPEIVNIEAQGEAMENLVQSETEEGEGHQFEVKDKSKSDTSILASTIVAKIEERVKGIFDIDNLADIVAKKVVESLKPQETEEIIEGDWLYEDSLNTFRDC